MKTQTIGLLVLGVALAAPVWAEEAESKPEGFIEGASLNLLNRNYYRNIDDRSNSGWLGPAGYSESWGHSALLDFQSGYTEGVVGFGMDAHAYGALKLDSGRGRADSSMFPLDSEGSPQDSYAESGGAAKARLSATELKYGQMRFAAPVFNTGDSFLIPETATGFHLASNELEAVALEAGYITAYNNFGSTNSTDDLGAAYGSGTDIAKTLEFVGATLTASDATSAMFYASEFEETWRQYYVNVNHTLTLSDTQQVLFDMNSYLTRDTGDEYNGEIDSHIYSAEVGYVFGAHTVSAAYQHNNGDEPLDYVGYDSIWLNNAMLLADFNGANETSWSAEYAIDLGEMVAPGLSAEMKYTRGDDIDGSDADPAGAYAGYYGDDGKHWERDISVSYVVQEGMVKDLSVSLVHGMHRSNDDQGEGDTDEVKVVVEFPYDFM